MLGRATVTMIAFAGAAAVAAPATKADPLLVEMQKLEWSRNAAIKAGDLEALARLYAPDFAGTTARGATVGRDDLFRVFERNKGGDFIAESVVLAARRVGGAIVVKGRLKLYSGDRRRLLDDSLYLHVFRRRGGRWEMIAGAATPVSSPSP